MPAPRSDPHRRNAGAFERRETCPRCGGRVWSCSRCGQDVTLEDIFGGRFVPTQGRILGTEEFAALVAACLWRGEAVGFRDAAIMGMLRALDLPPSDLVRLDVSDWNPQLDVISLPARAGRPSREERLEGFVAGALRRWMAARGREPGCLFLPLDQYGRRLTRSKKLQGTTVGEIVRKRAEEAGIGRVTSSDLRRTAIDSVTEEYQDGLRTEAIEKSRIADPEKVSLVTAAKALCSYRRRDDLTQSPLNELERDELHRLRRRISALLLWRDIQEAGQVRFRGSHILSTETRKRIAEAVDHGVTIREIARVSGITRKTISEYATLWREGKGIPTAEQKVGPEERRVLLEDLKARPEATAPQRRERLAKVCNCVVSDATVLRHLRSLGYKYDRFCKIWVPR